MSQLTQAAIAAALDQLLTTFGSSGGDIVTDGINYAPQAGKPYIRGRVATYTRTPLGVGPNVPYSAMGSYQINVYRPAIGGPAAGRSIAAQLVFLFPRGAAVALASGQYLTIESATEQPVITSGDWLTMPVTVAWYATE